SNSPDHLRDDSRSAPPARVLSAPETDSPGPCALLAQAGGAAVDRARVAPQGAARGVRAISTRAVEWAATAVSLGAAGCPPATIVGTWWPGATLSRRKGARPRGTPSRRTVAEAAGTVRTSMRALPPTLVARVPAAAPTSNRSTARAILPIQL